MANKDENETKNKRKKEKEKPKDVLDDDRIRICKRRNKILHGFY